MSNKEIIEQRISAIRRYLKSLDSYKKYSLEQIKIDETIRLSLERLLYLLTQSTIDLAEEIIALKKLPKPSTYGETFDILAENDLLSRDLAARLVNMAGFRNIIAHDYLQIDYAKVYEVLHNKLIDIEELTKVAEGLL